MASVVQDRRRLPGIVVKRAQPRLPIDPLRLDVAGLVGFAERGPLDLPVMIEDVSQYKAVFGEDVLLALTEDNRPIYAHLSRAVQAFFDNGGRRCYVVRVAGKKAAFNQFRLPGMIAWTAKKSAANPEPVETLRSVICPAAWVGSWSDTVNIATQLRTRPLIRDVDRKGDGFYVRQDDGSLFEAVEPKRGCPNIVVAGLDPEDDDCCGDEHEHGHDWDDSETSAPQTSVVSVQTDTPPAKRIGYVELDLLVPRATTIQKGDLLDIHFDDRAQSHLFFRVSELESRGYLSAASNGVPITVRSKVLGTSADLSGDNALLAFARQVNPFQPNALLKDAHYWLGSRWRKLPGLEKKQAAEVVESTTALPGSIEERLVGNWYLDFNIQDMRARRQNPDGPIVLLRVDLAPDDLLCLADERGETGLFRVTDLVLPNVSAQQTVMRVYFAPLSVNTLGQVERLTGDGWQSFRAPLEVHSKYDAVNKNWVHTLIYRWSDDLPFVVGDVLRLTAADIMGNRAQTLFPITRMDMLFDSNNRAHLLLESDALMREIQPEDIIGEVQQVDLLKFDLFIREGNAVLETFRELSFNSGLLAAGSPRTDFWSDQLAQPIDAEQTDASEDVDAVPLVGTVPTFTTAEAILKHSRRLGVPTDKSLKQAFFLPLHMSTTNPKPATYEWSLDQNETWQRSKDGLDSFDPVQLFLDPEFVGLDASAVFALANDIQFSFPVKRFHKLHSLFPVEEVGMIAIPDLVHRRWMRRPRFNPRSILIAERQDLSIFRVRPQPAAPVAARSKISEALNRRLDRNLTVETDIFEQLAALPILRIPWDECEGMEDVLSVHIALINLCAARADTLAILSLPYRYKHRDVLDWHRQLTDWFGGCTSVIDHNPVFHENIAGYVRDRSNPLSYAAVYHGWTEVREETLPQLNPLRLIPPDGTICGMIAAREIERGPGIAPANVALQGIVALEPLLNDDEWADLFERQMNVLRQPPGRFTVMSALTLSCDPLLVDISIRKLLIYLRKLVFREGERYVFENNTERFRRSVQAHFERILNRLVDQGALVAFIVNATDDVNTPNDVDNGCFIIEIKVAFTYPIEFITIVLMRSGESLLQVLEA